VVLVGADPAVDPDFWKSAEYAGSSTCGIGQVIQIANAEHIVIADLTMRNFAGKMLKVDGGTDNGTPWHPKDIVFHNLELWDCGSQMIKGAGDPLGSEDGILECSFLHYTDGLFAESSYETQGIDIHEGRDWIIRDNYFLNMRQRTGLAGLGSAILMWDRCDSVLAERNLIVNCNFAIKFGASWYEDSSDAMVARNNLIIWDEPSTEWVGDNVFEIGQSVASGGCWHNTVWNITQNPGNALTVCSNDYSIANNLYVTGTLHRCTGQTNNLAVDETWFADVAAYDLHLVENHTVPAVGDVLEDIEGNPRADPPSAGAFEYSPASVLERGRGPGGASAFMVSRRGSLVEVRPTGLVRRIAAFDSRGRRIGEMAAAGGGAWRIPAAVGGVCVLVAETARGERITRHVMLR
jgi:hypothetical protein